jgi:hypothetical protein
MGSLQEKAFDRCTRPLEAPASRAGPRGGRTARSEG